MSSHAPGAMRAAAAIANARSSVSTAEGDKSAGELADFIEAETRIVELIDASQRLLQSIEADGESPPASGSSQSAQSVPPDRIEQLRAALLEVLEDGSGQQEEPAPEGPRRH